MKAKCDVCEMCFRALNKYIDMYLYVYRHTELNSINAVSQSTMAKIKGTTNDGIYFFRITFVNYFMSV